MNPSLSLSKHLMKTKSSKSQSYPARTKSGVHNSRISEQVNPRTYVIYVPAETSEPARDLRSSFGRLSRAESIWPFCPLKEKATRNSVREIGQNGCKREKKKGSESCCAAHAGGWARLPFLVTCRWHAAGPFWWIVRASCGNTCLWRWKKI
jgi:hypothetical protein